MTLSAQLRIPRKRIKIESKNRERVMCTFQKRFKCCRLAFEKAENVRTCTDILSFFQNKKAVGGGGGIMHEEEVQPESLTTKGCWKESEGYTSKLHIPSGIRPWFSY